MHENQQTRNWQMAIFGDAKCKYVRASTEQVCVCVYVGIQFAAPKSEAQITIAFRNDTIFNETARAQTSSHHCSE